MSLISFLIWAALSAGPAGAVPCGTIFSAGGCCHVPVEEITCCAGASVPADHECACRIEAASGETPGILTPPPAAPRAPLTALLHTREDTSTLFRDSEKAHPRFPNLGNAPPLTGAASLQIWRF